MGIKLDPKTGLYTVSFTKRHPITRIPVAARRIKISSKAEAQRVYNALVVQVEDKLRRKIVPTWSEAIELFANSCRQKGLQENTVTNYLLCLNAHTSEWKDRFIDSITSDEIRELIYRRLGKKSQSHQKNLRKFINGVFSYAVEAGKLQRNPTPDMRFRIGEKLKVSLTVPQSNLLLNKAKEINCEWYPHWAMALYTGMRNGELFALTWDKVDLERRIISVNCSWSRGKGFKSTKSGDDRKVEIAPPLLPVLAELKLESFDRHFVLPRLTKWEKGEQARELRAFLAVLGLPRISFHDLRASWATIMLSLGVEPIKVMAMGGWKDLKTMQIYIRKAGVDIQGITDNLRLHNPSREAANVVGIGSRSNL